jgi:hypothetical protein
MRHLWPRGRSHRQVVARSQATLDRSLRQIIARRALAAGLIGLAYGICTGVILAAYQEFGSQSVRGRSPAVAVDAGPLKLVPQHRAPDDTTRSRELGAQGMPAAELADAAHAAPATGQIRPALARTPDAEPAGEMGTSAAVQESDSARHGAGPAPVADDPLLDRWSAAAAPEAPPEASAAAPPEAASAAAVEAPHAASAFALPPSPAFKPLEAIPTVMAEAALAQAAPEPSQGRTSRIRPPKPSFKPLVNASGPRSQPAPEQASRPAATTRQTLPDALRAFWTNLKILLASAPASSDFRTGRSDSNGNGAATRAAALAAAPSAVGRRQHKRGWRQLRRRQLRSRQLRGRQLRWRQ